MKKILFLIGGLLSSLAINAQIISYGDVALLFSSEENNGTARFNAMSGAFGALGGDLSAGDINPAGLAVFNNTEASITFGLRNTDIITSFANNSVNNSNDYFNMTQAGGVIIFDNNHNSNWSKIALGFNYSLSRDYDSNWLARGNSEFAPNTDIHDPDLVYGVAEEQIFENFTDGRNDKFVFSIAAQRNEKLYLGASINTYNFEYSQLTIADELNNDGNGNTLDVRTEQELRTIGNGVSFSVGAIIKPSNEMRLGITFQSPIWYNLSEERSIFDHELIFNEEDSEFVVPDNGGTSIFDYELNTPSRLTGSFAYIFGREGLLSFDYTYKNYQNIKLKPTNDFAGENEDFSTLLKGTSSFRIGAEWRIDNVSLRGGYHFDESPFEDAIDTEHIKGYSVGVGFKFKGNVKLDLAYQNSTNTEIYDFLNVQEVNPNVLDITNDKFTATLVIGL